MIGMIQDYMYNLTQALHFQQPYISKATTTSDPTIYYFHRIKKSGRLEN